MSAKKSNCAFYSPIASLTNHSFSALSAQITYKVRIIYETIKRFIIRNRPFWVWHVVVSVFHLSLTIEDCENVAIGICYITLFLAIVEGNRS